MSARQAIVVYRQALGHIDSDMVSGRIDYQSVCIRRQWLIAAIQLLEAELVTL